jgi:hypothetical protein
MAEILQGGRRDLSSQDTNFTVTNITADSTLNCNEEAGCLALADVVGTLIRELIRKGIINGTVA